MNCADLMQYKIKGYFSYTKTNASPSTLTLYNELQLDILYEIFL